MRYRARFALLLALTVFATPATWAKFKMRSVGVRGDTHLFLRDVARYYGMDFRFSADQATLSSRYSTLRFVIDKREAELNGVSVHLSLAPCLWNREPLLSELDFRLLLDPILRVRALPRGTVRRIVLDPGHGGRDHGATGARYREKDLVLELSRQLARALKARGYDVILTRTGDQALALARRPEKAAADAADIFVSIHANYTASKHVSGAETFLLSPQGTASTYGKRVSTQALAGNRSDKCNARLAYEIQRGLVACTGCPDRGVKHARFQVLREATCPAVLVEVGFLSNPHEERLLGSAPYQAKVVAGMVNGIVRYHESVRHRN